MEKKIVHIVSSMRSGSTLLKALLATKEEVTDLPEVCHDNNRRINEISETTHKKIIVIKHPYTYRDNEKYPYIDNYNDRKVILLVRNPYDTILSLKQMNISANNQIGLKLSDSQLLDYWCNAYTSIINNLRDFENCLTIYYENLVNDPVNETNKLFKFIGTKDEEGVDSYNRPVGYDWKWGLGDGSNIIKLLKVQKQEYRFDNANLLSTIRSSQKAQDVLIAFKYESMFPVLFNGGF